jgi:hypothetical protein
MLLSPGLTRGQRHQVPHGECDELSRYLGSSVPQVQRRLYVRLIIIFAYLVIHSW